MKARISSLDFLRGFAIVAILLLHNLEHFDYYHLPQGLPDWMIGLDKGIWSVLFWLFAGKAYSIFALLFGVTFYIQQHNQNERGNDFRLRFIWRLFLLFCFGIFNSCFFQGDILTIYAVLGLSLVLVARASNKTVFIVAFLLLLQPVEWGRALYLWKMQPETIPNPASWQYFGKMAEYIPNGSFLDVIVGNLTNGKLAVYNWNWESGRVFQTPALFMLGLLLGRTQRFVKSIETNMFWRKTLIVSLFFYVIFTFVKMSVEKEDIIWFQSFEIIINTWLRVTFTFVWVALLLQFYWNTKLHSILDKFSILGRMSLTNYVVQSIFGACIYYGFGLKLYLYTGATYSLLIAIFLSVLQWYFSKYWLKRHKRGILEQLWHNLTWIRKS